MMLADFRDFLVDLFQALGEDASPERTFPIPGDTDRRIDVDLGPNGGIEAKVNDSPYKPSQRRKDDWLRRNRRYPVRVIRFFQWRCFRR